MSENIGKFFAPNGTAVLEVDSDNFRCSSNLNFPIGGINYLNTDNYHALVLSSGQAAPGNTTYKPEVILFPNSSPDSHYSNKVVLRVYDNCSSDGTTTTLTLGDSKYGAKINGNHIESIYSSGDNYIQYTNGLGICWIKSGNTTVPPSKITFPFSFIDIPAISISPRGNANSNIAYIHKVGDVSSTGCVVMAVKTTTDSEYIVSNYTLIAIGMWKPV